MPRKDVLDAIRKYTDPFRVTKGKDFRLKDFDPGDTRGLKMDKQEAAELLQRGSEWLAMEQDILYAQDSWALLLVFQAMDAAGKDGTDQHVIVARQSSGGRCLFVQAALRRGAVARFPVALRLKFRNAGASASSIALTTKKSPLCVCTRNCSRRRSYRRSSLDKRIWDERLADIARFEDYLTRQGVVVLLFYLNLSREQQKKRFMERLDKPDKNWKFSAGDVRERRYWDNYMHAYEEAICATASKDAPWFLWCPRTTSAVLPPRRRGGDCRGGHELLDLEYPKVTQDQRKGACRGPAQSLSRKSRWTTRT